MHPFRSISAIAIATIALFALPSIASGAALTRSGTGTSAGAIQGAVDQFRTDLGGLLNPNNGQSFPGGRREINWDGVPDSLSTPNEFPEDFFNQNSPRGVEFESVVGTGFQVSADSNNLTNTPVEFGNFDAGFPAAFQTFSSQRLFTPISAADTEVRFFVPGTDRRATVSGFGAIFTDVDAAGATKIEYFDRAGVKIHEASPPATNNGLSFVGTSFTAGERVGRVVITTGTRLLATGTTPDSAANDVVVMDDLIYGEPQPLKADVGVTQTESADPVAAHGKVTYTVQVRNDGPDPADNVFVDSELTRGNLATVTPNCDGVGGDLVCAFGRLDPGESATVEFAVDAPENGEIAHTARVSSRAADANPANDSATEITAVTPTEEPEAPAADERAPEATVTGFSDKLKLKQFVKNGIQVELDADEASSFEVALLGSAKKVTLGRAKAFDVTLATASLPLSDAARTVTLKPQRKFVKKARKLTARVQVVATDAAGNEAALTRDLRVKK